MKAEAKAQHASNSSMTAPLRTRSAQTQPVCKHAIHRFPIPTKCGCIIGPLATPAFAPATKEHTVFMFCAVLCCDAVWCDVMDVALGA